MNCCKECFADTQIREVIESTGIIGNCDFCGHREVKILPSTEKEQIEELLGSVLDIYRVSTTEADGKLLKHALTQDWNIFSVAAETAQAIITEFCTTRFSSDAMIFSQPVYVPLDADYMSDYGITRGRMWKEFSEIIKHENRFHSNIFNSDAFASFLSYAASLYTAGTRMYRARIGLDRNGVSIEELGVPPMEKRSAGRINPEGVGVLYLSSESETALYEVRASMYDYVTVGEFVLKDNLRIVNLASISSISPFIYTVTNDLQQYAANKQCLQEIADEIAKPMRRNDSPLEYLPTQFISEFIKSQGYDGVEYTSTMTKHGFNFAIFDDSHFDIVSKKVYEIKELSYLPEEI